MRDKKGRFIKGSTPDNKGKHHSEETKLKISLSKLGRKESQETRDKKSLARIGSNNPNYGKHWNKGVKEKIRQALTGNKLSEETRLKMSLNHADNRGEKHWNWQGGIYPEYLSLRYDSKAKKWSREILKRDKTDDTAWVWMASVAETPKLRRKCLEEALKHNPRNKTARKALENMEEPETTVVVERRQVSTQTEKLPVIAHILCGWPLLLVAVGGMIGGALGGVAYGINIACYKSSMPVIFKIILNIIVGSAAIVVWIVSAVWLQSQ